MNLIAYRAENFLITPPLVVLDEIGETRQTLYMINQLKHFFPLFKEVNTFSDQR